MELRERITSATKQAMKDKATSRLSTLRLINAAFKDRDIAARAEGIDGGVADPELLAILAKMVKQRRESARTYEEGGRLDLAEAELSEIEVIEEFLPRQLGEPELAKAVDAAISSTGAASIRDMGKVMGMLKPKVAGRTDMSALSAKIKARLG